MRDLPARPGAARRGSGSRSAKPRARGEFWAPAWKAPRAPHHRAAPGPRGSEDTGGVEDGRRARKAGGCGRVGRGAGRVAPRARRARAVQACRERVQEKKSGSLTCRVSGSAGRKRPGRELPPPAGRSKQETGSGTSELITPTFPAPSPRPWTSTLGVVHNALGVWNVGLFLGKAVLLGRDPGVVSVGRVRDTYGTRSRPV